MDVKIWECDYCCLPKLKKEVEKRGLRCAVSCGSGCPWRKKEMLPLIEGAQIKEYENGGRRPPREIVDYGAIVDAAISWLEKDV